MRFRVYTWACLNVEPETTLVVFEGENYACGWNGLISSAIHSTPPPKALWRHLLLGNLARDEISPEGAGVVAFCSRSNMFQSDQDPWECRFLHFYGHLWPIPSWKNDQWQMWQPFPWQINQTGVSFYEFLIHARRVRETQLQLVAQAVEKIRSADVRQGLIEESFGGKILTFSDMVMSQK